MGFGSRSVLAAFTAILLAASLAEARQAPVMSAPSVLYANITFNWTATAGATGYRLEAGVVPGVYLGSLPLGPVTTFGLAAPAVGTFFVRVVALTPGGELGSNEVQVVVTSLVAPPGVPTAVQAYSYCNAIGLTWAPGAGASPSNYVIRASRAPGTVEISFPVAGTQFFSASPGGTIYFRVAAVVGNAVSDDSPEVSVETTAGIGNTPPVTFSPKHFGSLANVSWSVPGAAAFAINAFQDGTFVGSAAVPAHQAFVQRYLPAATWRIDATPIFPCGSGAASSHQFSTPDPGSAKMLPREADPPPGGVLDRPAYLSGVVRDIANRFAGDLGRSCVEHGGNNRWLFRLVSELRTRDKRWGLNWKRANVGDMSQDIVTFNWGDEADEGTRKTRVFDVIGGHCGPNPGYNDTEVTVLGSSGSIWTLAPFLAAGNTP